MKNWTQDEGIPEIPGATYLKDLNGFNFSLFSKNARTVELLFYNKKDLTQPVYRYVFDPIRNKTHRIWHCFIPEEKLQEARYYAYRIDGPLFPEKGSRFDRFKLLLDPFAKGVYFPENFSRLAASEPGSNEGKAPLAILPREEKEYTSTHITKRYHTNDAIIYEMHVSFFTSRGNSGVTPSNRGTFRGVIEKIPYLQDLGVTIIELMPVFQCDPQEGGAWGYMPLNFFSPDQRFGPKETLEELKNEFRDMVEALHQAGIEVILDVVFNHTTEVDDTGPTYSFRGIDNSNYYLLSQDMTTYLNESGTGNALRCNYPYVRKLIMESLRYWVKEMHVDGFRFDLASIFARNFDGSLNLEDPAIISEISSDPELAGIRLIGEVWDMSGSLLGKSFPGISWYQWNGKFRDDVRRYVRGDKGMLPALMMRMYGSDDLFPDDPGQSYRPFQSINYVTCHDGFCLYDLVSYNQKHNEINGRNNQDGISENFSWNCGAEGHDAVTDEIKALRERQAKNFASILFLSNGTPMFYAGDEFLNTQRGNNNPFNQDNHITWLDWDLLVKNRNFHRFFKGMLHFRKKHPSLCRSYFWRDGIQWLGADGHPLQLNYDNQAMSFLLDGSMENDQDICVLLNAGTSPITFHLTIDHPEKWKRIADTGLSAPEDFIEEGQVLSSTTYRLMERAVAVLIRDLS